jgi:hypothetical protein
VRSITGIRARGRTITALAVTLVLAAAAPGGPATSASAAEPAWSVPVMVDQTPPNALPRRPTGIACPSVNLCVAVDKRGNLITSTDPAGGSQAWTVTPVDTGPLPEILGISCPTTTLCIAVTASGWVLSSTDPAGGAAAWTATPLPGAPEMTAVSCPTATLCVAADNVGDLVATTDPTGGSAQWHVMAVDPDGGSFTSISCAVSPSDLCVATDGGGNLVTSTNPTGGTAAWTITKMGANGFDSVSCPSSTLCVGGLLHEDTGPGQTGTVFTSTDPTAGAAAWTPAYIDPQDEVDDVYCDSVSRCFAADRWGNLFVSSNPAGGPSAWSSLGLVDPNQGGVTQLACAPGSLCVGLDLEGNAVTDAPLPPADPLLAVTIDSPGTDGLGENSVSGPGIDCPGACRSTYLPGTTLTLTATPAVGQRFTGWSGGGCGGTGTCTIVMSTDQSVTATFRPNTPAAATAATGGPNPAAASPPTIDTGSATSTKPPAPTCTPSCATTPPAPVITRLTLGPRTATVAFAPTSKGDVLQCSLVRRGRAETRHDPPYAVCRTHMRFRGLRPGGYTLYARSVARDKRASHILTRSFTLPVR